jgi:hypothetical protein
MNCSHNIDTLHIAKRRQWCGEKPRYRLQIAEPIQRVGVNSRLLRLIQTVHIRWWRKFVEDLALVRQVHVEIWVSGFDRSMTQPRFDDVWIDPRFQQVDRCGMAQAVRREGLGDQARTDLSGSLQMPFDQRADAKSIKSPPALVDEEIVVVPRARLAPVMLGIELQKADGRGPKRGDSFFPAFAQNFDGPVREVKPGHSRLGHLGGSGTRVVEEDQDGEISDAVRSMGSGLLQKGLQLLAVQKRHDFGRCSFGWEPSDLAGRALINRVTRRHPAKEGLQRSQTLIPGVGRIATTAGRILQVFKERFDGFDGDILHARDMVWPVLGAQEQKQKLKGIAVTADGMEADTPLFLKIGVEKFLQQIRKLHGFLKASLSEASVTFSKASRKRPSPSRSSDSVMVKYTWVSWGLA